MQFAVSPAPRDGNVAAITFADEFMFFPPREHLYCNILTLLLQKVWSNQLRHETKRFQL